MTSDAMAFPMVGFDLLPVTSLYCTIDVDARSGIVLDALLRCDSVTPTKCMHSVWLLLAACTLFRPFHIPQSEEN